MCVWRGAVHAMHFAGRSRKRAMCVCVYVCIGPLLLQGALFLAARWKPAPSRRAAGPLTAEPLWGPRGEGACSRPAERLALGWLSRFVVRCFSPKPRHLSVSLPSLLFKPLLRPNLSHKTPAPWRKTWSAFCPSWRWPTAPPSSRWITCTSCRVRRFLDLSIYFKSICLLAASVEL